MRSCLRACRPASDRCRPGLCTPSGAGAITRRSNASSARSTSCTGPSSSYPRRRCRRGRVGSRPHAGASSRAVQSGDPGLSRPDPAGPGPWRVGAHRFSVRRRRGGGGVRGRPCPRPHRRTGCAGSPRRRRGRGGRGAPAPRPPGAARYCLAIGTAEPRKDLPGLVRAFAAWRCGTPMWPLSWPVPRGGERTSCASRWTRRPFAPASPARGGSSRSS